MNVAAPVDQGKAILRIVNHMDNFKTLTMKTSIISTLKNYYGHLKDKIYNFEENNPHHIPYYYASKTNEIGSHNKSPSVTRMRANYLSAPLDGVTELHERSVIDDEIHDLLQHNDLVEEFDILPTAFLLTAGRRASDQNKFKIRFSDIHIGKGLSQNENVPEKHCKNNQWILKPASLNQGRGI